MVKDVFEAIKYPKLTAFKAESNPDEGVFASIDLKPGAAIGLGHDAETIIEYLVSQFCWQ